MEDPYAHLGYYFESEHPSAASTPFASAPSSPGRNDGPAGFYFSAPPSPSWGYRSMEEAQNAGYSPTAMARAPARKSVSDLDVHSVEERRKAGFFPTAITLPREEIAVDDHSPNSLTGSDFEFSARFLHSEEPPMSPTPMTSASELFYNGEIRAFSPQPSFQHPFSSVRQLIAADGDLLDSHTSASFSVSGARSPPSVKYEEWQDKGNFRRISDTHQESFDPLATAMAEKLKSDTEYSHGWPRSFAPLKMLNTDEMAEKISATQGEAEFADKAQKNLDKQSRKWSLKGLLQRSSADAKEKNHSSSRRSDASSSRQSSSGSRGSENSQSSIEWERDRTKNTLDSQRFSKSKQKNTNAAGIRSSARPLSPHELHYTKQRAQTEEMKRKTFLPYRQGLLGCLGFSSKGYRAMTQFSSALQPVS